MSISTRCTLRRSLQYLKPLGVFGKPLEEKHQSAHFWGTKMYFYFFLWRDFPTLFSFPVLAFMLNSIVILKDNIVYSTALLPTEHKKNSVAFLFSLNVQDIYSMQINITGKIAIILFLPVSYFSGFIAMQARRIYNLRKIIFSHFWRSLNTAAMEII